MPQLIIYKYYVNTNIWKINNSRLHLYWRYSGTDQKGQSTPDVVQIK